MDHWLVCLVYIYVTSGYTRFEKPELEPTEHSLQATDWITATFFFTFPFLSGLTIRSRTSNYYASIVAAYHPSRPEAIHQSPILTRKTVSKVHEVFLATHKKPKLKDAR